jgi:Na+-translocating ferredoxin:NAD+ oxidoreductase RnfC subunit
MRSLAFTATGADYWSQWAALCCSCGLCTLFACPEQLFPKEACDDAKAAMRKAGLKWAGPSEVKVHPLREGRRVPIKSLVKRLAVEPYDLPAPWLDQPVEPAQLILPLKQSAGVPATPVVRTGDRVRMGQLIAEPASGALGACLHAPADATVTAIAAERIHLSRAS